jgi:hypothetical protein
MTSGYEDLTQKEARQEITQSHERPLEWVRIKSELLDFLLEALKERDAATKRIAELEEHSKAFLELLEEGCSTDEDHVIEAGRRLRDVLWAVLSNSEDLKR